MYCTGKITGTVDAFPVTGTGGIACFTRGWIAVLAQVSICITNLSRFAAFIATMYCTGEDAASIDAFSVTYAFR